VLSVLVMDTRASGYADNEAQVRLTWLHFPKLHRKLTAGGHGIDCGPIFFCLAKITWGVG
jgi:hypothetical protein